MNEHTLSQEDKIKRGAEDAWEYFRHMMEFVGFTSVDSAVIRESSLVVEKHIPSIVAEFYTHLLRYPPTRSFFLKKDGTIDLEYVQKRMHHLTNFWRRTASGNYDQEYARYIDYVGLAHTARGADPNIYIAERYVIGQIGFMQRAIGKAIYEEYHEIEPDLERKATHAWNMLMMVLLEMLARPYEAEPPGVGDQKRYIVDPIPVYQLAVETYERGLGLYQSRSFKEVLIGSVAEIPDGSRKIVQVDGNSIGIFHHKGQWSALLNYCLHAGGPVVEGHLEDDTLVCPWHGFRYCVTNGELLVDPALKLETFQIIVRDNNIYLVVPDGSDSNPFAPETVKSKQAAPSALKPNEFAIDSLTPGQIKQLMLNGEAIAVYNVDGAFFATSNSCTHADGPLSEGELNGFEVICPWHGSCFDVRDGSVHCGPADEALKVYKVIMEGNKGRVE